jgi:hypothetical protein
MAKKGNVLSNVDEKLVSEYSDKSIKQSVSTKLEFNINIAGTDFNDIEEAINYAYRCGLADSYQIKKTNDGKGAVDQDELYKILKTSHSLEHKSDFLREIAKEWFPLELHEDKKIKTVNIELNELADYLKK